MKLRDLRERLRLRGDAPGRDGVRALVRLPAVQGVMVLAVVAQVVAVQHDRESEDGAAVSAVTRAAEVLVTAAPADTSYISSAWAKRALERRSREIASKYRSAGYPVTEQLATLIHSAAVENGIEPEVAFGLIRAESSFRTTATSPVGAVGLTQLMPKTAAWLSPETSRSELRDPATNIRIGFGYLRQLIDKYEGDVDLALVAYNRGPGTVDRALRQGRNPDNGYSAFVRGERDHGHTLYTR